MVKHSKDIIILGYSGTANECPFDAETWGVNQAGKYHPGKKVNYCFAFDKLPSEYITEMKAIAPIISWQDYGDIRYPIKRIIREFRINYFVNTVCYMLAYAIFNEAERIGIYGGDTFLGATWQRESKGIEFWLGIAHGRGIELRLPPKSELLRSMQGRIYGRDGREILLTLSERLQLIKILPEYAPYDDELYASTLRWIFNPKKDEQDRYNIHFGYDSSGQYTVISGEQFRIDVPMAEEVWQYLRKCMVEYERVYGLSENMLGLYEMLTASEWREGEYKEDRNVHPGI